MPEVLGQAAKELKEGLGEGAPLGVKQDNQGVWPPGVTQKLEEPAGRVVERVMVHPFKRLVKSPHRKDQCIALDCMQTSLQVFLMACRSPHQDQSSA